jgi:hypothetical protein
MFKPATGCVEDRAIVGIDYRLHRADSGMGGEGLHCAEYHRLPANRAILFRAARAGAQAAPSGDEDGSRPFRFCHATRIVVIALGEASGMSARLGAGSPYHEQSQMRRDSTAEKPNRGAALA